MMTSTVEDPLLWRTTSRFHDWMNGPFPRNLLAKWMQDGIIGIPEHVERDDLEKPFQAGKSADAVDRLMAIPVDSRGYRSFRASGASPHPWWVSFWIPAFDAEIGESDGYGMINLNIPRAAFAGAKRSAVLLQAMESLYGAGNCEFACIHPERHLKQLQMRPYENALVFSPMFAGMFWADFLGPGHIERFRKEAIDALPLFFRKWEGDRSVLLAVSDDVSTTDRPEEEQKLVAMTKQLREGLVRR